MSTVLPSSDQQLDRAALAALYEETFKNLEEGTITEGRVVAVTKDKVVVDIGYKSEGMIPDDQFSTEELPKHQGGRSASSVYRGVRRRRRQSGSFQRKSRQDEDLGGTGKALQGRQKHRRQDHLADQGRHDGRYRREGVPAWLQIDLHPVRDLDGLVGRRFRSRSSRSIIGAATSSSPGACSWKKRGIRNGRRRFPR